MSAAVARDEALVRAHLRAVVGSPVRPDDTVASTESGFVNVASRWIKGSSTDRRSLLAVGVSAGVLDRAGIVQPSAQEVARAQYPDGVFTIAEVATKACVSTASVRSAVAADELAGRVERVANLGRAHRWRTVRS